MTLARRSLVAALAATSIAATVAAPAPAAQKPRFDTEVVYDVSYETVGSYAWGEVLDHQDTVGSREEQRVAFSFKTAGQLGKVVFRNGSPVDYRAVADSDGLARGEMMLEQRSDDGIVKVTCQADVVEDITEGYAAFGDADEVLVRLDSTLDVFLHPYDSVRAIFNCDDGSTQSAYLDNGGDGSAIGEQLRGTGIFDIAFELPRETVGMGYVEQLVPTKAIAGADCPAQGGNGGETTECRLEWSATVKLRKVSQQRTPVRAAAKPKGKRKPSPKRGA